MHSMVELVEHPTCYCYANIMEEISALSEEVSRADGEIDRSAVTTFL